MLKINSFRFVVLLLGAGLLAACGQAAQPEVNQAAPATAATAAPAAKAVPTKAAAAATKVGACTLLPKEDVGKALGQAVDSAEEKGLGGVCSYKSGTLGIDLTVFHSGGTKYLQQVRSKLGADAVDMPGVGDEGFYNPNSFTLLFRKGDGAYLVFLVDTSKELTDADRQAKEKAIGLQLVSHLP